MKPPNFRELNFDQRDLDLIKSTENCKNCKWCYELNEKNVDFLCSKYKYELFVGINEYTICDSYEKQIDPPNHRFYDDSANSCSNCEYITFDHLKEFKKKYI